jgi:hypothetical protein
MLISLDLSLSLIGWISNAFVIAEFCVDCIVLLIILILYKLLATDFIKFIQSLMKFWRIEECSKETGVSVQSVPS